MIFLCLKYVALQHYRKGSTTYTLASKKSQSVKHLNTIVCKACTLYLRKDVNRCVLDL
jgi:hypothetical protein